MKWYFIIFLFISSIDVTAQNFSLFPSSELKYFTDETDTIKLISVSLDSSYTIGNDSFFVMKDNFLNNDMWGFCLQGSLLGKTIIKKTDSLWLIINYSDTMYFNPNQNLSDTFVIHSYPDESKLLSIVTGITSEIVLDNSTIVKTFNFSLVDSNGNLINNSINNKSIKLSDTYGIIQSFYIPDITYNLSSTFNTYKIVGTEISIAGTKTKPAYEFVNFEVGDVFHYKYSDSHFITNSYYSSTKDTIKSKSISINNDTVTYTISRRVFVLQYVSGILQTSSTFNLITNKIILSQLFGLNTNPTQLVIGPWDNYGFCNYSKNEFNNHDVFYYNHYFTQNDTCFEAYVGSCTFDEYSYASNIGLIYYTDGCAENILVYYHKSNGEIWGTQYELGKEDIKTENVFNIYPNPGSGNVHVQINKNSKNSYSLKIYNLLGKQLNDFSITNSDTYLDLNMFETGVYIFEITNSEKVIARKVYQHINH